MLINKTILSDNSGNAFRLSSVLEYEDGVNFSHFSLKHVVSGQETYTINNKKYLLKEGEYVLGNKHSSSSVLIDNHKPVKGICIDISKQIIQDVIQYQFKESQDFESFLFTDEFFINKFKSHNTKTGCVLNAISNEFHEILETSNLITKELFYTMAECVVNDQSMLYKQFSNLNFSKKETNKRLFEFVYSAKDYIDLNFHEKIKIENIAKVANLSEYHFIRLFKAAFDKTPHQYIIQKRLQFSKVLLLDKCSIVDVAFQSGFADAQSYTKAFKSAFGLTPNVFKKSN
uniref:helix-turn-helix domain-containing protein n=2 Tax=Gelidibacter sp. TaxID=2018083 RepID=UPI00404B0DBA